MLVGTLRVRGMGLYIAPSRLIITSYQLNGNGYVDEIDMRVSTKSTCACRQNRHARVDELDLYILP